MVESNILLIAAAVLLMAALYSTVGHGGGSGYLAVLAIAAIAPEQMRPTALILNIVVSSIATWKFGATLRHESHFNCHNVKIATND